jgi:serine/threonine-protein kinase
MECLDEETILAFCQGTSLAPDARARAQEHIAACDECRALVSAVLRSSLFPITPQPVAPSAPPIAPVTTGVGRLPDPGIVGAAPEAARGGERPGAALDAMAPTTPVGDGPSNGAAPVSPVQPGMIVHGKYEVERILGAGGMGIVVAARHTQLDQRVALKFLLPVACEVPGAVARFLREGKAAARITSEHVARVVDTGTLDGPAGGAPFLVMEYLEGKDLSALLAERGRLEVGEAIEYVLQAGEAISEAHTLGIVHRDLKPANLFLTRRADGTPLVKVLDFGISKLDGTGTRSELTSASMIMGSPRYMSPEQMLDAKRVDARTDVWALGVILFELVTGRPVWTADTVQGLCALIASAPHPPLRAFAPNAPEALERVVDACLAKSRDARPAGVADLATLLEPLAPPSARTSIDRILRVARRGRPASVPPSSPVSAQPPSQPPASAASASTSTSSSAGKVAALLVAAVAVLLAAGVALNAALVRRASKAAQTATSVAPAPESAPSPSPSAAPAAAPIAQAASLAPAAPDPPATSRPAASVLPVAVAPRRPPRAAQPPPPPAETSRALTDRK